MVGDDEKMAATEPRFTRQGHERLQTELDTLKAQRAEIINDIKEAREQGDLKENHAYHHAKDMQGMAEARIAQLEARLSGATILEEGEIVDEVIQGVPVHVRALESGQERTYTIVTPEELDDDDLEGGASTDSPVGQALLGKRQGEIAEVQGPNGVIKFEVLQIGL